jgi:hypothetical protein
MKLSTIIALACAYVLAAIVIILTSDAPLGRML